MTAKLLIGNKNTSSWSLRAWLLFKHFDIPFEEVCFRLDDPVERATIKDHSTTGKVPCLKLGDLEIWDSLAIGEYLAETYPDKPYWPSDATARARARSVTAEIHSGFTGIRSVWPMDIIVENAGTSCPTGMRADLERILTIWETCRADYGEAAGGPFLFGEFGIADAFYAPVVSRIRTYGPVSMSPRAKAYAEAIWTLPAMQSWIKGAYDEKALGWYEV